ncbi:MAG: acyltransferase [Lachnospiraceae bacterium]|nr:acyltransferase [Lachnospiraceae bacterium]
MQNIAVKTKPDKLDEQNNNVNKRSTYLDVVKAFAIICVIFGHCIQYGSGSNYLKGDLFLDNIIFKIIYSFHMPLFMLVSGYLFAHSVKGKTWTKILINRIRTLLLPILMWMALPFIIVMIYALGNSNVECIAALNNCVSTSLSNLWFLWAVFWCSLVVTIVSRFFKDSKIVYLLGFVLTFFVPDIMYLNLYKFMYPYFVVGYFYNKDGYVKKLNKICNYPYTLLALGVVFGILLFFYDRDAYIYTTGYCVLGKGVLRQTIIDIYRCTIGFIGSAFVLLVFLRLKDKFVRVSEKILKFIGVNTLGIYIISGFIFTYVFNRVTENIVTINYIMTIIETIIVLVVSLVCTCIIKKNKYLNMLLLGGRT